MLRTAGCAVILVAWSAVGWAADAKFATKLDKTPPPKELKDGIKKELAERSVQILDDKGAVVAELWLRKTLPAKATPEQVKNGLTYRELEEGTLVGALRVDRLLGDYRKQKIAPGVYTLRLGFQPMDGDHMGTSPHPEFCMLLPAALDLKPGVIEPKQLREDSTKAVKTSHPGVLLLFPNLKPEDAPKMVTKEGNHIVLNFKMDVAAGDLKAVLGFGLTVVGHSTLE